MSRRFKVYLGQQYGVEASPGESVLAGGYQYIEWLEPILISQTCNGEIGELRCIAHKHPEVAKAALPIHRAIQVIDENTAGSGEAVAVFDGVIVKHHLTVQGESEQFQLVAYNNADYLMHRMMLAGQMRRSHAVEADHFANGDDTDPVPVSAGQLVFIDAPLVFNPNGSPNMTVETFYDSEGVETNNYHIFEVPFRYQKNSDGDTIPATSWKLSDAVKYLLNAYPTDWCINPISVQADAFEVFTDNGDPVINNINLEGKSLLDGLRSLLEPHNYGFTCSAAGGVGGSSHILYFFYRGTGTFSTSVSLSPRGTHASMSEANAINIDLVFDSSAVVNNLEAYGDRISITTLAHTDPPDVTGDDPPVMKLVQGWQDADLEWPEANPDGSQNTWDTEFRKRYCHPENITIIQESDGNRIVYGIGRLWLVNLGENPGQEIENLTESLRDNDDTKNSVDPRQLEKPNLYTRNSAGGLLTQQDIVVEMSFDGGENWNFVEKSWYQVLPDSMGIIFTEPRLERLGLRFVNSLYESGWTYWDALHDNTLQIRILCSVKSDEVVKSIKENSGDVVPLATERLYENPGFKKVKYNPLINDTVYYVKYPPFQVNQNDEDALGEIADRQKALTNRMMISGTIAVTLDNFADYTPGMVLEEITNRDITFDPPALIVRVVYDLPSLHAQLTLDNRNLATVLRGRPITAANREQYRLGIENPTQMQGGHKVPYLPGDPGTMRTFYREGGSE